jgi:uncharacterized protein (TIGR02246 family)
MHFSFRITSIAIALSFSLAGCRGGDAVTTPADPSIATTGGVSASASGKGNGNGNGKSDSPQERAVRAAMDALKQAIIDSDVAELTQVWTDDYTFINPQGAIVSKAQRIANLTSGNTDVSIIDSEREITVRVIGDMAIVQNLSTLHGQFNGVPTNTDLRGTFVWVRRDGRWRLVTNQLTAVAK